MYTTVTLHHIYKRTRLYKALTYFEDYMAEGQS
eukprot:SAG31_NODE_3320_length_4418_cov_5.799259_3_plen_33_part_00